MKLWRRIFGSKYAQISDEGTGIAIIGSGSWATAVAKIIMENEEEIWWYNHRKSAIEDFRRTGRNPKYLSSVQFDCSRIHFSADLDEVVAHCHTLIFVIPSPYLKSTLDDLSISLHNKFVVTATKGLVPDGNVVVTEYLQQRMGVPEQNLAVMSGPSHAEEIALNRLTYLTVACSDRDKAKAFAQRINCKYVRARISGDVLGIEYAGVLKNIYAIASGITEGLGYGDNFHAVLMANAQTEMKRFLHAIAPYNREFSDSVYLGDLLVTGYSSFSRNHQFGTMLGKGYKVRTAQLEMQMIAEGYYGTKTMYDLLQTLEKRRVGFRKQELPMPILRSMYNILYKGVPARMQIEKLTEFLR